MKSLLIFVIIATVAFSTVAFAGPAQEGRGHGPCQQIREACLNAGFVKGDAKEGYGLWRDCINPIMQGITIVPGATKPLPSVDPGIVAACKAKHPKFGSGPEGSR